MKHYLFFRSLYVCPASHVRGAFVVPPAGLLLERPAGWRKLPTRGLCAFEWQQEGEAGGIALWRTQAAAVLGCTPPEIAPQPVCVMGETIDGERWIIGTGSAPHPAWSFAGSSQATAAGGFKTTFSVQWDAPHPPLRLMEKTE